MLFELMTLDRTRIPHDIKDEKSELEQHKIMRLHMQNMEVYPQEMIELVLSMMHLDPLQRPTALELKNYF